MTQKKSKGAGEKTPSGFNAGSSLAMCVCMYCTYVCSYI